MRWTEGQSGKLYANDRFPESTTSYDEARFVIQKLKSPRKPRTHVLYDQGPDRKPFDWVCESSLEGCQAIAEALCWCDPVKKRDMVLLEKYPNLAGRILEDLIHPLEVWLSNPNNEVVLGVIKAVLPVLNQGLNDLNDKDLQEYDDADHKET